MLCVQDAPYLRDVVVLETMEDMDKESHTKAANKKTMFCQYNFFNFTATLAKTRCTLYSFRENTKQNSCQTNNVANSLFK